MCLNVCALRVGTEGRRSDLPWLDSDDVTCVLAKVRQRRPRSYRSEAASGQHSTRARRRARRGIRRLAIAREVVGMATSLICCRETSNRVTRWQEQ
jgi:hypothetical protein